MVSWGRGKSEGLKMWHLNWCLKHAEGPGRQRAGGKCLGGGNTKDTGLGGGGALLRAGEEQKEGRHGWACGVRRSLECYRVWQCKAFGGFEVGGDLHRFLFLECFPVAVWRVNCGDSSGRRGRS